MSEQTMVERVARAICSKTNIAMEGVTEIHLDNPDYVIPAHKRTDGVAIPRWKLYVEQARAAIEAIRQPTKAMIEAGAKGSGEDSEMTALGAWEEMIDAALR
jgi:hypothetical protein